MKKLHVLFLFLCLLCGYLSGLGQVPPKIDSLRALIPSRPEVSDTKNLYKLASEYFKYSGSMDSIEHYTNQILDLAVDSDDPLSYIRGYYLKGKIAYINQDLQQAKAFFEEARGFLEKTEMTEWNSALPNALGAVNNMLDEHEVALEYYQEASKIAEENNHMQLGATYSNIAILLGNLKQEKKALGYFHKALKISKELKDSVGISRTMYSMVSAYSNMMQFDSAEIYTLEYLGIAEKLGYQEGILRGHRQLADNYLFLKKYTLSASHAKKVIEEAKGPEAAFFLMPAYRSLACCYAYLGDRQKTQNAMDSVTKWLDYLPQQMYRVSTYQAFSDIYAELGEYKTALSYFQQATEIQDSIYGEKSQTRILKMQELYETEKTQRKLLELQIVNDKQAFQIKQRTYLLFGFGGTFLLTLLVIYLLAKQRVYKAKEKVSEIEQRLLRLQMNPHFLFNVLSSIQNYLFDKADTQKAISYLSRFSHLMRQVLEYSREKYISLEEEVATLENYLALQQLRFDDEFDYEIQIDPELDPMEIQIPPLMAQPFVENSIEHGKVHLREGGKIWIRFEKKGGQIKLTVEDNGVGRAQTQKVKYKEAYTSLATHITRDRIEVLSDLSKKKFTFNIIDLPVEGTQVVFELPIIEI